jgi:ABC-type multidrug transport system fused ATPase/permease subunit
MRITKEWFRNKMNPNYRYVWLTTFDERSRRLAITTFALTMTGSALLMLTPYALGLIIDGVTVTAETVALAGLAIYTLINLTEAAVGWLRFQAREPFFRAFFWHVPYAITKQYLARPLSWLTSSNADIDGSGVEALKNRSWNLIGMYLFSILPGWGIIGFGVVMVTLAAPVIGGLVISYLLIEWRVSIALNKRMQVQMKPIIKGFKKWDRFQDEVWKHVDHVKMNGVEDKMLKAIRDLVQPALQLDKKVWQHLFARAVTNRRLRGIAFTVPVYLYVGHLTLDDKLPLSSLIVIVFALEQMLKSFQVIADGAREVQFDLASIDKYRRVLEMPVPYSYNQGPAFEPGPMSVTFDGVDHSVIDNGKRIPVLRNVNLHIEAGKKVGIVGLSGAGKSQLMTLLARASDPENGRVLIGEQDIRHVSTKSVLRHVGVVMQKSEPFEGTILDNLLFSVSLEDMPVAYHELPKTERASIDSKAVAALEQAGLPTESFSNGLHTDIGYKGLKLSGGQQQRLQIARTFLKIALSASPDYLLEADEPSASLDSLSESKVMQHLVKGLGPKTTLIMIAHRLSTVADLDEVIFVRPLHRCDNDTEQVTMHNSLAELYRAEPLFREMADAQGFVPEGIGQAA